MVSLPPQGSISSSSGSAPIQVRPDLSKAGKQQIQENAKAQVFIQRFDELCHSFSLKESLLGIPRESRIQTTVEFTDDYQQTPVVTFQYKEGTLSIPLIKANGEPGWPSVEEIRETITKEINDLAKTIPGFRPHPSIADRLFNAVREHGESQRTFLQPIIRPESAKLPEPQPRSVVRGGGILEPSVITQKGRRLVAAENVISFDGIGVVQSPLKDGHVKVTLTWEGRQFQLDVAGATRLDVEKAVKHQLVRPARRQLKEGDDFPFNLIISNLTGIIDDNGNFTRKALADKFQKPGAPAPRDQFVDQLYLQRIKQAWESGELANNPFVRFTPPKGMDASKTAPKIVEASTVRTASEVPGERIVRPLRTPAERVGTSADRVDAVARILAPQTKLNAEEFGEALFNWSQEAVSRVRSSGARIGDAERISARNAFLRYAENPARGNLSPVDMKAIKNRVEQRFRDEYINGRIRNREIPRLAKKLGKPVREVDTHANRMSLRKKINANWEKSREDEFSYKDEFENRLRGKYKEKFENAIQKEALQAGRGSFRNQIQQHYKRIIPADATLTVSPSFLHNPRTAQDLINETLQAIDGLQKPSSAPVSHLRQTGEDIIAAYRSRAIPLRKELEPFEAEIGRIEREIAKIDKIERLKGLEVYREKVKAGAPAYAGIEEQNQARQAEKAKLEGQLKRLLEDPNYKYFKGELNKLDQWREEHYTVDKLKALGVPDDLGNELVSLRNELASLDKDIAEVRVEMLEISRHLDHPGAQEELKAAQRELKDLQAEKAQYQKLKRNLFREIESQVEKLRRKGDLGLMPPDSQLSRLKSTEEISTLMNQLEKLKLKYKEHPNEATGRAMVQVLDDCLTMLEVAMRGSISPNAAQEFIKDKFPGFAAYRARLASEPRPRVPTAVIGDTRVEVPPSVGDKGARGLELSRPDRLSPGSVLPTGLGLGRPQPAEASQQVQSEVVINHEHIFQTNVSALAYAVSIRDQILSLSRIGGSFEELYRAHQEWDELNKELNEMRKQFAKDYNAAGLRKDGGGAIGPDLSETDPAVVREYQNIGKAMKLIGEKLYNGMSTVLSQGHELERIPGDGNCLFIALAVAQDPNLRGVVSQQKAEGISMRSKIADRIRLNKDRFKDKVLTRIRVEVSGRDSFKNIVALESKSRLDRGERLDDDFDFDCYCQWISRPGSWGSEIEIQACADELQQPISSFGFVERRVLSGPTIFNPMTLKPGPVSLLVLRNSAVKQDVSEQDLKEIRARGQDYQGPSEYDVGGHFETMFPNPALKMRPETLPLKRILEPDLDGHVAHNDVAFDLAALEGFDEKEVKEASHERKIKQDGQAGGDVYHPAG